MNEALVNVPNMVEVLTKKFGAETAVIAYILKKRAKYKYQLLDFQEFNKLYNLSPYHIRTSIKNLESIHLITTQRDKQNKCYYKWLTIPKNELIQDSTFKTRININNSIQ